MDESWRPQRRTAVSDVRQFNMWQITIFVASTVARASSKDRKRSGFRRRKPRGYRALRGMSGDYTRGCRHLRAGRDAARTDSSLSKVRYRAVKSFFARI